MKKARIITYYQVVDENGVTIDTAHRLVDAVLIRDRYNDEKKKENKI